MKAVAGFVRTRLPLMIDGLFHLDTDPFWRGFRPIRLKSATSDGNVVVRDRISDIGVEAVDGTRVYIDYVPRRIQQEWPNFAAEKEELGHAGAGTFSARETRRDFW